MMSRTDSRAPASHTASHTSAIMSTSRNNSLRREGSGRRSLRSMRCQSVVITEKEKTLLIKQSDKKASSQEAKVASKGFVRSMCKFYSDIIRSPDTSRPRRSVLDRSHSFGAVKEVAKELSLESISEKGGSEACLASPVSSRSGSFRLNRSRSWRGSRLESYNEAETPKRNSPTGQSVRSQDSGFSDSGENPADCDGSYESQTSSGPTSSGEETACDQQKSFVTKINIDTEAGADSHQGAHNQNNFLFRLPISENYQANCARTGTTPVARQKVNGSLDNIVSLQEGFKIKLESEARSLYNQGCDANVDHIPSAAANNPPHQGLLLRARPRVEAGDHPEASDLNPLSPSTAACPRFSTPVRASFRRRPQTMISMDEVHTPVVKRESRTRLKEIKSRRRWSNIDQDQSKLSPLSVNTTLNIKNSGSQYSRNNLNAESCYEFRNHHERRNSNLSPSLTALGLISPVGERSLHADGTPTRLMMDSFVVNASTASARDQTIARSINTIFPTDSVLAGLHSDTIIEHESCTSPPAPVQVCSAAVGQGVQEQTRPGDSSASGTVRSNQDPVYEWWKDLFIWTEPECMTYLQSKPIPVSSSRSRSRSRAVSPSSLPAAPMTRQVPLVYYPYEAIRHALENKRTISETFSSLKSHFSALNLLQMNKTIGLLTKQIRDFVYEHNLRSYSDPLELETMRASTDLPGFRSARAACQTKSGSEQQRTAGGLSEIVSLQEKSVLQIVDRLKLCAHRCQYSPSGPLVEMKKSIKNLEEAFIKFIELVISCEMKTVIGVLEGAVKEATVVDAINTVINLGNEHSSQMYSIISKVGTIRSLINLAVSNNNMEVKLLSLRAISSVCCTIEAVRELEQCNGIQTISNILVSPRTSLSVKVEAAGVLAQITSPWIADNHSIAGLKEQVPNIVEQLTKLTRIKAGDDTFLLVSAALANLTFMETQAVISMQVHKTSEALMRVVTESPFTSLFAKDQVVTVLANLASKEEARVDILREDGLGFLISLLATNPENTGTPAETAAAERVLKKTAIALSRLCSDPSVCHQLVSLRGLDSLVALVKDGSLRNYNDAVLVACLAVLRRVAHHCGHGVFDSLDARDLIDPKLMDSFLEYSSKQESYV